jgi:hypothetical protein
MVPAMARVQLRGRSDELGRALTVLRTVARTGQGAVVLVTGEAGIGKTALLQAIAEQAGRQKYAVGLGKAEEIDQIAPGAPLLVALRSGAHPLLDSDGFTSLAPLSEQHLWLIDRIAGLVEELAAGQPVLIGVDDAQWADRLTRFALRILPGRLAGSPVLWLLTSRETTGPAIDELTEAAADGVPVHRLELGPLPAADIESIAADRLGAVPTGRGYELLGGATEILRAGPRPVLLAGALIDHGFGTVRFIAEVCLVRPEPARPLRGDRRRVARRSALRPPPPGPLRQPGGAGRRRPAVCHGGRAGGRRRRPRGGPGRPAVDRRHHPGAAQPILALSPFPTPFTRAYTVMFPAENLRDWRGENVIDPDGSKIGELEAVYVDTATDEPAFASVQVGIIGRHRLVFVPLAGATVSPSAVRVRYPKKLVGDAPGIDTDGELLAADEPLVFAHYELPYQPGTAGERRLARR